MDRNYTFPLRLTNSAIGLPPETQLLSWHLATAIICQFSKPIQSPITNSISNISKLKKNKKQKTTEMFHLVEHFKELVLLQIKL